MIESSDFLVERSWSERSYKLETLQNRQPIFAYVGLISPLNRLLFLQLKMSFLKELHLKGLYHQILYLFWRSNKLNKYFL
jgi:hypothetical protein